MITAVTLDNIDRYHDLYIQHFQLRQREFIDRQEYDVFTHDGMEFDRYDSPSAVYLIHTLDGKQVLGASRLTKTVHGCMLADLWPSLVDDKSLLQGADIWEGTRFCIDSALPPDLRKRVCREIACAYVEYASDHNVKMIIGMMPTFILRSVFERSGIKLDRLGNVQAIPGFPKVQAAGIPINQAQLSSVKATSNVSNVLFREETPRRLAA